MEQCNEHLVEGEIIEPNVSVPIENPTSPADVADADPAEDPLEPSSKFQGFLVFPPNQTSPLGLDDSFRKFLPMFF